MVELIIFEISCVGVIMNVNFTLLIEARDHSGTRDIIVYRDITGLVTMLVKSKYMGVHEPEVVTGSSSQSILK